MKRIKVMQYFWGKLDAGGAETFIINLAEHMDNKLFEFSYCCYENKDYFYSDRIRNNGGIIVPLQEKESKLLPIRIVQRWINLYRVLKHGNYDVFHCNCDFAFKCFEMMIAKWAGIKVRICHSHNTSIDLNTTKGKISYVVHMMLRPLLVHYSTGFIACSEDSAKWLFGKYASTKTVLIAKNGINSDYFAFDVNTRDLIRKKMEFGNSTIIGNVGRFTLIKNQEFIIEMIKQARDNKLNYKACLIGDGQELERLKKKVKNYNIEDMVIFVGLTDAVKDYLMAFDCYVMPSLYEGLPVSGIEAQATGLQCIVSSGLDPALDVTGNVVFIPLDNGPASWLKEIQRLPKIDRNLAKLKIVDSGYDISETSEKMSTFYVNALA